MANNPMNFLINCALNRLNQNPRFRNNPQAQEMLEVIKTGDSKRGIEIANNLCETYGTTKDEAVSMAMNFMQSQFKMN